MGIARVLAKGWVVFCLFAGGYAVARALAAGGAVPPALWGGIVPALLFCAMGLLFVVGYGASGGHVAVRLRSASFAPGFNGLVVSAFLVAAFLLQAAPLPIPHLFASALQAAMRFAIPGQRALAESLARCNLDGSRALGGAAAWLLAFVFFASAMSHLRISATVVRLEAKRHRENLGPSEVALALGVAAVAGIQLLFVGSVFRLLSCASLAGPLGDVLIGTAPLMLAYLATAALINLFAAAPER